ncbi:TPA: permease [Candidatus Acetothermia bacterium]|nr:permease [Candidatus Acetothermia bacterium]
MLRQSVQTVVQSVRGRNWLQSVPSLRRLLWQAGPLLALALVLTIFSFAHPRFLTPSNMANIVRQSSVVVMFAVGQTLVVLTGGIDLSVGATAGLAASVSGVLMTQVLPFVGGLTIGPINWWTGMLVALSVGALVGAANGLLITRGRIPDFIATLGTLTALRGLALLVTGGLPVPNHWVAREVGVFSSAMTWLGNGHLFGFPMFGIIAVAVAILIWFLLRYVTLGRAIYAIGGKREAARVSGINVDATKCAAYVLCGMIAGLAGYLLAGRMNSANALMGDGMELQSIASVVIGGTNLFGGEGGVFGSVIGAFIQGALGNGLNMAAVSPFWQRVVQGGVILFVVIFDQWRRRRFRA